MQSAKSLKTLATELGVSSATISNALNNKGKISPQLRLKIVNLAKRHGYQPSPHARVLHGRRMQILGLMVTSLHDGMAQGFFMGIDRAAMEFGYSTIVSVTAHGGHEISDMELQTVQRFNSLRIGGVLYLPAANTQPSKIESLMKKNDLPFVLLYRRPPLDKSPAVLVDHRAGFSLGLDHLLSLRHRRVGFVYDPQYQGPELKIAKEVLHQKYPDLDWNKWSVPFNSDEFAVLLKRNPTALFTLSDDTASQVADYLTRHGKSIPTDISLIGFRDTIVARSMRPKLTTLHVPAEDIGYAAAHWLVKKIEMGESENSPPIDLRLAPQLVVRESTGPAKS